MQVRGQYCGTVSSKGQVTIPLPIREMFDLGKRKQVIFEVRDGKSVSLRPAKLSLEQAYGAVKPIEKSFAEIREIAREVRVKRSGRYAT